MSAASLGSDWEYAFRYTEVGQLSATESYVWLEGEARSFVLADVAEVIAASEGEPEERDWLAVVRLHDGRFVALCAGCDVTGWDCQSGGQSVVARTLPELVRWGLSPEQRERLGLALESEAPRG